LSLKNNLLKGTGVPSVQAKFDELFAPRVETKIEKPKRVAKKRVAEKKEASKKARSKRVKTATKKRK
jgi:hypothetical protein